MGIGDYGKDILAEGPIVFVGNGIPGAGASDCCNGKRADYTSGRIDVSGCVVAFSSTKEFPFLTVGYDREDQIPDIPVIAVTKGSILSLLASERRRGRGGSVEKLGGIRPSSRIPGPHLPVVSRNQGPVRHD